MNSTPPASTESTATQQLDTLFRANQAQALSSLSPHSLSMAFLDWAMLLAASPGKQSELSQLALTHLRDLSLYMYDYLKAGSNTEHISEPLKTDRRFSDPAWNHWPFNVLHQSFLLTQSWWEQATSNLPGVSPQHLEQVSFWIKQWLDIASPYNLLWTNPVLLQQTQSQGGMNLVRGMQNMLEDIQRKQTGQGAVGTENFRPGHEVAVTPGKVVMRNELAELIQYAPTTKTVRPEPVFVVPAWIMKYYILDLSPQNSLIRYLCDQGYTVFALSWKNPNEQHANLGMDDYLQDGFFAALDTINDIIPKQKIHATGYCLGGTLLSIAAAAMARDDDHRLASISLLAAQIDFSEPGEISLFLDEAQVQMLEAQMQQRGYLSADEMAGAFQMLRSYDLIWSRMVNEYLLGERQPLNDLMAWNADATRMPARMHSEYLRRLYLNNDLSAGRYLVGGRAVSLSAIRQPVFSVGTVTDHVAPWRSVYKQHQFFNNSELTFVLTSGGHNAGIVSRPDHPRRNHRIRTHKPGETLLTPEDWMETTPVNQGFWWPAWIDWLNTRSGKLQAPPSLGSTNRPALDDAPGHYVLEA